MQGKSVRVVLGIVIVLAASACAGKASTNITPGPDELNGGRGGVPGLVDLSHRDYHVADVSGTTLTGGHVSLAALPGKLKVVNFWGSWCAPCIAESQGFGAVAKEDAKKGVSFLGIDERDNTAAALANDRKYGIGYPSIVDSHDSFLLSFPGAVPAYTPTTILIDSTGHILAKVAGPLEYTQLRALVNRYLSVAA